jgi:hypothetical protein
VADIGRREQELAREERRNPVVLSEAPKLLRGSYFQQLKGGGGRRGMTRFHG